MSSKGILIQGGGGGVSSDELTATLGDVIKGKTVVASDTDDEIGTGTLELTGTAEARHVREDKTFYSTDAQTKIQGAMVNRGAVSQALNCGGSYTIPQGYHNGSGTVTANSLASQTSGNAVASHLINGETAWVNGSKITGTLAVQSILSFSAAPYSTSQITFTWKNPAKGAFSGVIIVGKTGSTPTSISDGTRYYKGSGNNTSPNGTSTQVVGGFTQGTTYYFRAFSYAVKDNAEWIGGSLTASTSTTAKGSKTFTSSGTFTVPSGVRTIDIFCVGGGGAGGGYYSSKNKSVGSGGAGGGYTATKKGYAVTPGQTFAVTVGAGGSTYQPTSYEDSGTGGTGGTTSFGSVVSASGGKGSASNSSTGGAGGSGGGAGGYVGEENVYNGTQGGSDGSDGVKGWGTEGKGQGSTTRAFAESSGTLYAGGGAGGAYGWSDITYGGEGGGGTSKGVSAGGAGTANTGGGGSGVLYRTSSYGSKQIGGAGGSGICIVRWGY